MAHERVKAVVVTLGVSALVRALTVHQVGEHTWSGSLLDLGWGRVFGGLVMAQALGAASASAPAERNCHSLHAHFLRAARLDLPVQYRVRSLFDGGSFSTRHVDAVQGEAVILTLLASYQCQENGLEHADDMPVLSPPDPALRGENAGAALDWVPSVHRDPHHPLVEPPTRHTWFRTASDFPNERRLRQQLLAFVTDAHFLTTSLQPHGLGWMSPGMQCATISHALFFHRPWPAQGWAVHDVRSPSAHGGRGLVRGSVFHESGMLLASTVQEGLVRLRGGDRMS